MRAAAAVLLVCIVLLIYVFVLLTINTAASADMKEENRQSSAIWAAVIMFSAIAADSAVEINTGAAFEKNKGYIAAQSAAESSA